MDWLDLLAVQDTLKSFLQHHSSKASILRCSAFFTVQLSHPYMTTGKTIALTRRTFVGKVIFLLLNMLTHCKLKISEVKDAVNTPKLLNIMAQPSLLQMGSNIYISLQWTKSSNTKCIYKKVLSVSCNLLITLLKVKNRRVVLVQNAYKCVSYDITADRKLGLIATTQQHERVPSAYCQPRKRSKFKIQCMVSTECISFSYSGKVKLLQVQDDLYIRNCKLFKGTSLVFPIMVFGAGY